MPEQPYETDDIKVQFHPSTNIPDQIFSFDDYSFAEPSPGTGFKPTIDISNEATPWYPFNTRTDFDLAELMADAHLNHSQVKTLLEIVRRVSEDGSLFTLTGTKDLDARWEVARNTKANKVSIIETMINISYVI